MFFNLYANITTHTHTHRGQLYYYYYETMGHPDTKGRRDNTVGQGAGEMAWQ